MFFSLLLTHDLQSRGAKKFLSSLPEKFKLTGRNSLSKKGTYTPLLPNAAFLHVGLYVASFLKIGTHLKMRKLLYYKIFRNPIILLMKRPTVKHNEEPPTASYFLRIPKCMLVAYSTIQLHVHQCDILICVIFYKRFVVVSILIEKCSLTYGRIFKVLT